MNLYESFSQGRKDGEERRRTRTVGQYFQQAAQGDKAAQQQVYAVDPSAGMQAQKFGQEQEENDLESVARAANFFANTRDPKAYSYLQSRLSTMPQFAGLPATLDTPEDQEGAVKFAQGLAQAYGNASNASANSVQSRFVNEQGEVVVVLRDGSTKVVGKADPKMRILEGEGGYFGVNERNLQAAPVQLGGGQPQMPQQGAPMPQQMPEGQQITPFAPDVNIPQSSAEYAAFQAAAADADSPNPTGQPFKVGEVPYTPFQAPPGANTFGNGQRMPQQQMPAQPQQPAPQLRPAPKAAPTSEIEKRLQLAAGMGASADEQRQLVLGRDAAAAGAKPMPTAALKMIQDETNAANSAQAIDSSLSKQLDRINAGKLDFGPVSNLTNRARNAVGASTEESRNYQEFVSDLERLRNDSLRLNSGVQTDGDAQRAWNELFANINDTQYVKQRLETIRMLNQRAEQLRRLNVDMIRENYGKGEGGAPAPTAAPAGPRRLKFNPATGKLE